MNSKFLWLIDYSLWKLYSATFSLLILTIYCWWAFAYQPLQNTIDSYLNQIRLLPDQSQVSVASKKKCRILAQELKKKKAEMVTDQAKFSQTPQQLYCSVEGVIGLVAKNNIILQNYIPDKRSKQSDQRSSFSFFLLGTFYQYMNLFTLLEEKSYSVNYKKCSLKKIDESTLSCHLSLYL